MPKTIHHINILVDDIEKASASFSRFLDVDPIIESLPIRQAISARFDCNGIWLVLVSPLTALSPLTQIIETRGEGVFLLSFESTDIDADLERLTRDSIAFSDSEKRKGADDWEVQDIRLPYCLDVVLQLCQSISK
ncbi:VOC family protein [Alteromonas sp. A079]|uniref:VOC family protein n=1 Tax=Alteromonas sp. A079 TaxID=3410268 RepID=UPI003B9F75D8